MTENYIDGIINEVHTLEDCLKKGSKDDFPRLTKENDSYWKRYLDLKEEFKDYPVEMGALIKSIEIWMRDAEKNIKEINTIENRKERECKQAKVFENDPIIYLNKHGESHIMDVQRRAFGLLEHFRDCKMSFYELYILMCAVVVHDIGNIHGREGHEEDIEKILSQEKNLHFIPDANERRTICRIARTHGGAYNDSKDTISALREAVPLNGFMVRERLLAAILRFSDELADDYTRAAIDAMESGLIKGASRIYHQYSESLHTVQVVEQTLSRYSEKTDFCEVCLSYSFDSGLAYEKFDKLGNQVYLIDEIYDRTIKMERERRYCMRFMRRYISLEKIHVNIDINDRENSLKSYPVEYVLEERGYPPVIYKTKEDIGQELKSGCEMEELLKNEGYQ